MKWKMLKHNFEYRGCQNEKKWTAGVLNKDVAMRGVMSLFTTLKRHLAIKGAYKIILEQIWRNFVTLAKNLNTSAIFKGPLSM